MKTYVFLTPAVGGMGGAQMYTENKALFLEKNGWKVLVFYSIYFEETKLPFLSQFKEFRLSLGTPPHYVPKWKQKKMFKFVKDKVGVSDEVVVESHFLWYASWGELIARRLGGRHIINFLEEGFNKLSNFDLNFYEYKLKRWEFMNSSEMNLRRIFGDCFKEDYLKFVQNFNYICTNVVTDDISLQFNFKIQKHKYTILSIGRLDKPYIRSMIEEIVKFANKHPQKDFGVIFVGGSDNGEEEIRVPQLFKEIKNVTPYVLGYTYPIPSGVIDLCDVAIASANSILVSSNRGIPTICVDMDDHMAMGIYGKTTTNKFLRKGEPKLLISNLLEEVLIEKKYKKESKSHGSEPTQIEEELMKQLLFLEKSKDNKGYYDIDSAYGFFINKWCEFKWYVHTYLKL